VIDARPRGGAGLLAFEQVEGRSMLERQVELARGLEAASLSCQVEPAERRRLAHALLPELLGAGLELTERRSADAFVLRTDRIYDPGRLRRQYRRGGDSERAVIWRLDTPAGLAGAETELLRRRSYQPLGRYWALAPARALARWLAPTRVRPNAVTLAAALLMLTAGGLVSSGASDLATRLTIATLLALGLVLDTADGHLARLQGTSSAFGRWLDAVLDEVCDMALHAAVAWAAYAATGQAAWLLAGMAYAMGKHLFLEAGHLAETGPGAPQGAAVGQGSSGLLRRVVRLLGHADIRWHAWIVLAACGALRFELLFCAAYYPARLAGVLAGKAVRRADHG
jgi:phosphatidylglycerophosphate synthase